MHVAKIVKDTYKKKHTKSMEADPSKVCFNPGHLVRPNLEDPTIAPNESPTPSMSMPQ